MTSPASATPDPARPSAPADAALFDAVAAEHGVIYGSGLVSAYSTPDVNDLVSAAVATHRKRREAAIARLGARHVDAPPPAAGYQLPLAVDDPMDAATLAVSRIARWPGVPCSSRRPTARIAWRPSPP